MKEPEPREGCLDTLKRWILYAAAILGSIFTQ